MKRKFLALLSAFFLVSTLAVTYFVRKGDSGGSKVAPGEVLTAKSGKLIHDIWEAAYYLDGTRAGNIHTEVREIE